jgi:transcriptional regulator with XRE-family HTH domain
MAKPPLQLHQPDEIVRQLANRIRAERLRRAWKQETLANRSGVSLPTVRRYERTGRTSIGNLLKLCQALGRLDEFNDLLKPPPAASLAELEARSSGSTPRRKRGVR